MSECTPAGSTSGASRAGTAHAASQRPVQAPATGLVLGAALLLGVAGNILLRAQGPPGLNFFLWSACVAACVVALHRRAAQGMSAEALASLGVAVLFTAGMVWRDAPALKVVALACAIVCFALPAWRAGAAWIRGSGIASQAGAVAAAAGHAMFGAALALTETDWQAARTAPQRRPFLRRAAGVVRGVALALPLLIVFGALFMSADAVFAALVEDVVRVEIDVLVSHVVLTFFLAWITAGYLRGSLRGTYTSADNLPRPTLGFAEVGTVIGLLAALFLVFVIVQFRYLFGGSELVNITPNLTYAEYARRGFFELVAVVALMLPLLLLADWLLRRDEPRDERAFRALAGVQVVFVLAVLASALQRLRLYQDVFGLTESRFYAGAVLLLAGVVLLWFAATVLRGRREQFAAGVLLAVLATGAVLYMVNPDAIIVRTNVARMQATTDDAVRFDVLYAASLSADAVPELVAALPALPADLRCPVARRLLDRWPPGETVPLRTWNWSAARARRQMNEHEAQLLNGCPPVAPHRRDVGGGQNIDQGAG